MREKIKDEDVLAYAAAILRNMRHAPLALAVLDSIAVKNDALALRLGKLVKSHLLACDIGMESTGVSSADGLLGLVWAALRSGTSAKNALKVFVEALERDITARNKLKAKTYGSAMLTQAGIAFFFPLFSGICLALLNGQVGFGISDGAFRFAVLSIAYVFVMLYISVAFANVGRKRLSAAIDAIPYALLALAVFAAAYSFVGTAI
ncbi:MAG: hypothetical protein ACP5T3_02480 [Candidatus Micrarchaeia archaeon]